MALCRLLGVDNSTVIVPTDTAIVVSTPSLQAYNPDMYPEIQLLNKQIEANHHQVTMARAEMLPTVGLSAGYTYYGNLKLKGMTDLGNGNFQPYSQEFRDGMGMFICQSIYPFSAGENVGIS